MVDSRPCDFSLCKRHVYTLRRASIACERRGCVDTFGRPFIILSYLRLLSPELSIGYGTGGFLSVSQRTSHLSGDFCRQTWALTTGQEDFYQRLKEHHFALAETDMRPKFQASQLFRRTNTVDRNSTVSCGDPWHIANLDSEHEVGRKKGSSSIGHLHNRRSDLSETVWCFASSLSFLWWTMHAPCGSLLAAMSRSCKCCKSGAFALWQRILAHN